MSDRTDWSKYNVPGAIHPERLERFEDWTDPSNAPEVNPPQCSRCVHLLSRDRWACNAFPEGIPGPILRGAFDHTKPFVGDGGIRFEPIG